MKRKAQGFGYSVADDHAVRRVRWAAESKARQEKLDAQLEDSTRFREETARFLADVQATLEANEAKLRRWEVRLDIPSPPTAREERVRNDAIIWLDEILRGRVTRQ